MKLNAVFILIVIGSILLGCSQEKAIDSIFKVTAKNLSDIDLPQYGLTVDLLPTDTPFVLVDSLGAIIPIQLGDQNQNGIPDWLYFQCDIAPGSTISVKAISSPDSNAVQGQKSTGIIAMYPGGESVDTVTLFDNNPFAYNGIIWENDWIAYRLNTTGNFPIDILAKNTSELIYHTALTGDDYNFGNEEDILDENYSLGLGGPAIYDLATVIPAAKCDQKEISILSDGPLMASFQIIYRGIPVRGEKIDLKITYQMEADKEWTQGEFEIISRTDLNVQFAIGLPRHPDVVDLIQGKTLTTQFGYTFGMQTVEEDQLGMAILLSEIYDTDRYFDDPENHFLLVTPVDNKVQFRFFAAWVRGRNVIADEAEFVEVIRNYARVYSQVPELNIEY